MWDKSRPWAHFAPSSQTEVAWWSAPEEDLHGAAVPSVS